MPSSIPQDNKRSRKFHRQEINKSRHPNLNFKPILAIAGLGLAGQAIAEKSVRKKRFLSIGGGDHEETNTCFTDSDLKSAYCIKAVTSDAESIAYKLISDNIRSLKNAANKCYPMLGQSIQAQDCQEIKAWKFTSKHSDNSIGLQSCISSKYPSWNPDLEDCLSQQFDGLISTVNSFYKGLDIGYAEGLVNGVVLSGVVGVILIVFPILYKNYCKSRELGGSEGYQRLNNNENRQQEARAFARAEEEGNVARRRSFSSVSTGSGPEL